MSTNKKRHLPTATDCQREDVNKRQRKPPADAQWSLKNVATLDLKSFALHFGLTDKCKTVTRYRNILNRWVADNSVRSNLLRDLENWGATVDYTAFWQERARTATVAHARAACSSFVDKIIMDVTPVALVQDDGDVGVANADSDRDTTAPVDRNTASWTLGGIDITELFQKYRRHVDSLAAPLHLETSLKELLALADLLFLAPNDHSPVMVQTFGRRHLQDICQTVLGELMPAQPPKVSDSDFIKVTNTINAVDDRTTNVREAKRDLLNLAAKLDNPIGCVVEGLANLFTKLPRLPILDMSKIGEVELQSTYFDAFLSEIIADQDQQVALRWANKSVDGELSDIRPDAIISTLVQHAFGHPLGFGETKVHNGSTTKKATNLDIFRLGVACKRAIDRHDLPACLAFMIAGYSISFFIVSKRHDGLYTMVEIASLDFASSLSGLHAFATRKNLDLLAAVNQCFWTNCAVEQPQDTRFEEGSDELVPISDYLTLMAKTCKGTLGQSSHY